MFASLLSGAETAKALIDAESGAEVTYGDLRRLVTEESAQYRGLTGKVVIIGVESTLNSVIRYLSLIQVKATLMLVDDSISEGILTSLIQRYQPAAVVGVLSMTWNDQDELPEVKPCKALEERVLLGTSGTTGSPKYVRLSESALLANAQQIVLANGIIPPHRAMLTLPLHYSYGLSVLHSHLFAGATVILGKFSHTSPQFRECIDTYQVTSLFAVPYSVSLLRRTGFLNDLPKSVRQLTVAGGKLATAQTAEVAQQLKSQGASLYIRYGATEASAAIAILPAEELPEFSGSVGYALAEMRVWTVSGNLGPLQISGPNLMIGYAFGADDLGVGSTVGESIELEDEGHVDDAGRIWVSGRIGRFAKVHGRRINLDDLEHELFAEFECCVFEMEDVLAVVIVAGTQQVPQRREMEKLAGLPPNTIKVFVVPDLPRTLSGKLDRSGVTQLVDQIKNSRADLHVSNQR